ncbi:MAG: vanadium-dependent haloperoxidase [Pyrinomonadaceae bacterium]|nr:vanadium-dependent haloperoxidase [Pyrinomonadaceae bacterium]
MLLEKKTTNRNLRAQLAVILLVAVLILPATVRADGVTEWNESATTAAVAAAVTGPRHTRVFAMTHAAIHDALNAIDRRYKPYALDLQADPNASPEAAVAAAAHDVLVHEIPTQQAFFDAKYAASLASIPDGAPKTNGIAIGQAAAASIIALRSADGSTAPMPYTPGTGLGVWQPTPPAFLAANVPGWGNVTPFTLRSGSQFRPRPPAFFDLARRKYAREYNEVKMIGDVNSTTRTAEQSEIARFWYEGSGLGWNRIARIVSTQQGLDLWENARLFGLVNFAMADGFIAGFEAKYFYNFWRPVTAIRVGDTDGNDQTLGDPAWTSFLITPNIPDYPSTHSVLGAAAAEVLARFFDEDDDDFSFDTTSGNPFPGITRSFASFSQAAQENADSRVYAGIHFRTACTDGLEQGRRVGRVAFKRFLKPVRSHDNDDDDDDN